LADFAGKQVVKNPGGSVPENNSQDPSAMPFCDHFRPPLADRRSWDGLHGQRPAMIVVDLNRQLPERYVAEPQIHLGSSIVIDDAAYDQNVAESQAARRSAESAAVGTVAWAPPSSTLAVATDPPALDEYEVRV
jgi:hypothetical protein